jgi:peptide deformylase
MVRPIRTYPDKVLRNVAEDVIQVTDDIRQVVTDMLETMCSARGVGLAANQIGVPLRIITIETEFDEQSAPLVIINPEILESQGEDTGEEGCLSIPGFYETVKRAKKATVRGSDLEGKEFRIECEGLLARACQHELDHLNGILFVDHLSPIKKQLFKREYAKEKK